MKSTILKPLKIMMFLLFGQLLSGCSSDYLSEYDCATRQLAVHVDIDNTMALYKTIESRSGSGWQLRYTVKVYRDGQIIASKVT